MSVIYLLLPLAILLAAAAVGAFIWAARQGQFDDLSTPAIRVATEDELRDGSARRTGDRS